MTLQAIVLMAFSDSKPRPFTQLAEELALPEDILKRTLHSLACGKFKVLRRSEEGDKGSGAIKTTDTFSINEQFSCQMRKIRIPMASLEESHNPKRVEEDRSIAIEAAIVRIIKVSVIQFYF